MPAKLLKTQTFIDLVDLSNFLHEHYDWPAPGSSDSFHRVFSEAMDYPGQDTMCPVEMPDEDEDMDVLAEDYVEQYVRVVGVLRQLVQDGHLPRQDNYNILVWW